MAEERASNGFIARSIKNRNLFILQCINIEWEKDGIIQKILDTISAFDYML